MSCESEIGCWIFKIGCWNLKSAENCPGRQFFAVKVPRATVFCTRRAPGIWDPRILGSQSSWTPIRIPRALIYRACAQNQASGELAPGDPGPAGKDISAPAEDLLNENPSLVALGKNTEKYMTNLPETDQRRVLIW